MLSPRVSPDLQEDTDWSLGYLQLNISYAVYTVCIFLLPGSKTTENSSLLFLLFSAVATRRCCCRFGKRVLVWFFELLDIGAAVSIEDV